MIDSFTIQARSPVMTNASADQVAACPFCNLEAKFSDVQDADPDFKSMSLTCCVAMTVHSHINICSKMSPEEVYASLRARLIAKWNSRAPAPVVAATPDLSAIPRYRWGAMSMNREDIAGQGYYLVKDVVDSLHSVVNITVSHDFETHRTSWRNALVLAVKSAAPKTVDSDDAAYWERELKAFDSAFEGLLSAAVPVPNDHEGSAVLAKGVAHDPASNPIFEARFDPAAPVWTEVTAAEADAAVSRGLSVRKLTTAQPGSDAETEFTKLQWSIFYDNLGVQPYASGMKYPVSMFDSKEAANEEIARLTIGPSNDAIRKHYVSKQVKITVVAG